jgi:hypothetical protein
MAFPLLLGILNYCLYTDEPLRNSRRSSLGHCTELISQSLSRHEGADEIPSFIMSALASVGVSNRLKCFDERILAPFSRIGTSRQQGFASSVSSMFHGASDTWQELLVKSPRLYLGLARSIDFALSSGGNAHGNLILPVLSGKSICFSTETILREPNAGVLETLSPLIQPVALFEQSGLENDGAIEADGDIGWSEEDELWVGRLFDDLTSI